MGGSDQSENLVALTPEEHFVAHLLLAKMYPDEDKLLLAVSMMHLGRKGRPSRKMYGWIRRRFSTIQSVRQTGEGNSQYGKIWVSDVERKISIKVDPNEIPEGFEKGRNLWNRPKCIKCGAPTSKGRIITCRACYEPRAPTSRPITYSGKRYKSIRSASIDLGVAIGTVQYWIKTGKAHFVE